MKRAPSLSILFVGATLSSCTVRPLGDPADASTSSSTSDNPIPSTTSSTGQGTPTSSGPTNTSTTSATTSDLTTEPAQSTGTNDGNTTATSFDVGGPCDLFAQDCPEGQKCAAYASDGGNAFNATKCVHVTGDRIPGEPCSTDGGGVSGKDDCIKGATCWDVSRENVGTCVALCKGTSCDEGICDPGFFCAITAECVLPLCLPTCDPLLQDCPDDDLCLPIDDSMVCVLDASGEEGQVFDPCEFANACDPGLVCAGSASASECDSMATGCCVPMCSVSAMQPCPGVGQSCVSLYEEGMAPPEFADIGFCTLPP